MNVSGFTFVHNALEGGYPVVEAVRAVQSHAAEVVAVDMASTDGTRDVLQRLGCRVLDGEWGSEGGETLNRALLRNAECEHDVVLFFEADEVYCPELLAAVFERLSRGVTDVAVHRIQVEQNFQRARWYPWPVHRVWFPKGSVRKVGETTDRHAQVAVVPPDEGLLWDVRGCFRDNLKGREKNLAELFDAEPVYRAAPVHFKQPTDLGADEMDAWLAEPHWTWKKSPFVLPEILKPLVGTTKYEARL